MAKKTRTLTEINYFYLRPVNDTWTRESYRKRGFRSRSAFMDALVTFFRQKTPPVYGPGKIAPHLLASRKTKKSATTRTRKAA